MNRRTLAKSVSTLIIVSLMMVLITSCSGGGNNSAPVTVTSIVFRDAPTTTTAAELPKYANYSSSKSFTSEANRFSTRFPVFDDTQVVTDLDMPADSKTTWYKTYFTTVVAAQQGDKLIYCRNGSKACSLNSSFNVSVYPDNAVNRQAFQPSEYETCADVTFTGVPGRDCKQGPNEYSRYYSRDVVIYRNGKIYRIHMFGDIPDENLYDEFVKDFGFPDAPGA